MYKLLMSKIFSGFNTQKSLKSFSFWHSYLKNKKVGVFWDTVFIKKEIKQTK